VLSSVNLIKFPWHSAPNAFSRPTNGKKKGKGKKKSNKRKEPDPDSEGVFEKLFGIAATKTTDSKKIIFDFLKDAKNTMESAPEDVRRPARNFTLEDAVGDFNLTHSSHLTDAKNFRWTLPEDEVMEPSECFGDVSSGPL